MSLIKCPACSGSVSTAATACPHCGHPLRRSVAPPSVPIASKGGSPTRLLLLLLLLGITAAGLYKYVLSSEQRDTVNQIASVASSKTGVAIVPWIDRADTAARKVFEGDTSEKIATAIQGITHPTGKNAHLRRLDVEHEGDVLVVRFTVDWHGGFLGGGYTTAVEWKFSQSQNLGISVISDDAAIPIASSNLRELQNMFQQRLYPALLRAIG
jgi:hypothetical protein